MNTVNTWWQRAFANLFLHRVFFKTACLLLLPACAAASLVMAGVDVVAGHVVIAGSTRNPSPAHTEWPLQWQGQPLQPLALTEVEQRFAQRFPGTLARLTDGQQVLVMRRVDSPTRMLHPAVDCYQGLGYQISGERLELQAAGGERRLWRCFEASRAGSAQKLRVCERIEDAAGQGFTDTSAWYWAAALGRSQGPWQAVTVARLL